MISARARCISYLKKDGIYAILDTGILPEEGLVPAARAIARAGVRLFQLRAKGLPDKAVASLAGSLKRALRKQILLVNDRVDIALLAKADGVHVGQEDAPITFARRALGERRVVGVSAGNPAEVRRAAKGDPDYVSLGPAFSTRTKPDAGRPLGPEGICRLSSMIPGGMIRVAVGGITADNVGIILRCGIDAVAVAFGLSAGPDRGRLLRAVKAAKAGQRGQCGGFCACGRQRRPER